MADGFIKYVDPSFNAAEAGIALNFFEAWGGALAYTFRLYFDFSGYSDMAIGLARMFGIVLPLNFDSPYKATSIIDFWRRWHLTLSRFLRDYIYIPLGGNRKGKARQYAYLMITMLLGGLWHGAGWTFIFWGGLHGFYLIVNHAWLRFSHRLGHDRTKQTMYCRWGARLITFIAVVVGWVFFRAETFDGATGILFAMFGGNGLNLPEKIVPGRFISAFLIVWFAPNTQQILSNFKPALEVYAKERRPLQLKWLQWEPNWIWLIIVVAVSLIGVWGKTDYSQFVYFNF